jgi:hypothetical protein
MALFVCLSTVPACGAMGALRLSPVVGVLLLGVFAGFPLADFPPDALLGGAGRGGKGTGVAAADSVMGYPPTL